MTTKVKTQQDAANEIRNAIIEFELTGKIEVELKDKIAYSMRDIQVRDFLMGITAEGHSLELISNFLEMLAVGLGSKEIPTVNAVLASYRFRLGNTVGAIECLSTAIKADPDHSLSILLGRVIRSGWEPSAFDEMSTELHPKVVKGIEEGSPLEIA
jgi:hypothetical protein